MHSVQIPWPADTSVVTEACSRHSAWFWLDGETPEASEPTLRSFIGFGDHVSFEDCDADNQLIDHIRTDLSQHSNDDVPRWVVAFSYEFGLRISGIRHEPHTPFDAVALLVSLVVELDHSSRIATIHATEPEAIQPFIAELQTVSARDASTQASELTTRLKWRDSRSEYVQHVNECLRAIRDGDAYVLCLTDIAEALCTTPDPLAAYLHLRSTHPEIRGAVIATPRQVLVSASPERFLSIRDGKVSTTPMKGTRAREHSESQDRKIAQSLSEDQKERSENLMIVDLMRNDLSKVSVTGTVRTERFLEVETHAHVHQLVSTITGELRDDADVFSVLASCMPGGSMTGAPKHKAVEILAQIEGRRRGLYAGCFGWISGMREAELAMTIRSIEFTKIDQRWRVHVGAGGGITADSKPEAEFDEKQLKARALFGALGQSDNGILEEPVLA